MLIFRFVFGLSDVLTASSQGTNIATPLNIGNPGRERDPKGKEVTPMGKSWNDREKILAAGGGWMVMAHVFSLLGIVFALLGVVSDAINVTLGLESISWFLLAIASMLFSLPAFIGWHSALHLDAMEAKGKKKE